MNTIDHDKIWERLKKEFMLKHQCKVADSRFISTYSEHDNPDYQRGMFIDPKCVKAKVHSYTEMQSLLEELQKAYPSDVKMFSAGKSEGYGSHQKALDVWGLHLFATETSERTAFFVAGHHPEFSGPETVYLVAKRLLVSYHAGNQNVKNLRNNSHLVFIPQVDVDLYDNLSKVNTLSDEDYFEQGYSWLIDTNDSRQIDGLRHHEMNFYTTEEGKGSTTKEEYLEVFGHYPFAQTEAIKKAVCDSMANFGEPLLSIDYHEGSSHGKFAPAQLGARAPPYFVLAEIAKSYPVTNEQELKSQIELEALRGNYRINFSDIMNAKGADSYVFEAPKAKIGYPLEQRIEMNLIATDRILARCYLGL